MDHKFCNHPPKDNDIVWMGETPITDHDFTKISWQDYATCNGCGSKIQFIDNPSAHKEMMEHECPEGST